MPRFVDIQSNFSTGELDPLLRSRVELDQYNKVYQIDMNKDTIIYRVIGSAPALTKLRSQREDFILPFT